MNKRTWTNEQLIEAVKNNYSMRSTLKELNIRPTGGNYKSIHNNIDKMKLDTTHWTGQGHNKGKTTNYHKKRNLSEILVENASFTLGQQIKRRLLKEGILENKCSICGKLPFWNNKPLVMILDHINGVNNDHRLDNLRLVCPDCNSQLPTHCGRNKKKQRIEKTNYFCKKCGKQLVCRTKTGCCIHCFKRKTINVSCKKNKEIKKFYCRNCNKEITNKSKTGLCISCSQRNKSGNLNRPSIEQLKQDLVEFKNNFSAVGRKYNVSDNAIRKWLFNYEMFDSLSEKFINKMNKK